MKKIIFTLVFTIISFFYAYNQEIDSCFESGELTKRYRFFYIFPHYITKKVYGIDCNFHEKKNKEWFISQHRNDLTQGQITYVNNTLPLGNCTRLYSLNQNGWSNHPISTLSFKILEPLKVGQIATFSFLLLSYVNVPSITETKVSSTKKSSFNPKIYLSKRFVIWGDWSKWSPHNKLNKKHLVYIDTLDKGSMNNTDFVIGTVNFLVTKEIKKSHWIHLSVNNDAQGGYVLSKCTNVELRKETNVKTDSVIYQVSQNKDSNYVGVNKKDSIFFDHNSFEIKDIERKKMNQFMIDLLSDSNLKINISAFADKSGNIENNLILSTKRAQSVKEYLLHNGVNIDQIIVSETGIANFGKANQNRICILELKSQ